MAVAVPTTILSLLLSLTLVMTDFLITQAPALACSCTEPSPPPVALGESQAVFSGRVLDIEPVNPLEDSSRLMRVLFSVRTAWKGARHEQIIVSTARMEASCGFEFKKGAEYLVYASDFKHRLSTSLCSRTKALSSAAQDIAALGPGSAPSGDIPESELGPFRKVSRPPLSTPSYTGIVMVVALAVTAGLIVLVRRWKRAPK